jgi:hypothetical protein
MEPQLSVCGGGAGLKSDSPTSACLHVNKKSEGRGRARDGVVVGERRGDDEMHTLARHAVCLHSGTSALHTWKATRLDKEPLGDEKVGENNVTQVFSPEAHNVRRKDSRITLLLFRDTL